MKWRWKQSLILVVLTMFPGGVAAQRRQEGCVDPKTIVTLLAKIRETNLQDIPLDRLRAMWPTELTDIECDSNESRSLISNDRIIDGHCQCCVVFEFKVQQKQDGTKSEQLHGVIVNYSTPRRNDLVNLAKRFALASGLRAGDVRTIGSAPTQSFQWDVATSKEKTVQVLELRFTREAGLWKLNFNRGSYVLAALLTGTTRSFQFGGFISEDSIGLQKKDLNLHGYVRDASKTFATQPAGSAGILQPSISLAEQCEYRMCPISGSNRTQRTDYIRHRPQLRRLTISIP